MAMNGVNMPLSIIGTQGVWFETLLEYGFTEREALAYLSGPAYWPWQLMTNLEGAMPPPDRRYVEQSISLGRKILERERSLGMTPIQQGYSGHVPSSSARNSRRPGFGKQEAGADSHRRRS